MARRFYPPTESDVRGFGAVLVTPYAEVHRERIRAHVKHDHPDSPSMERRDFDNEAWLPVLVEEVGEVSKALNDFRHATGCGPQTRADLRRELRAELVQVAAMACAWIDACDLEEPDIDDANAIEHAEEIRESEPSPLWWHVFGGVAPEGDEWSGCYVSIIFGESTATPEEAAAKTLASAPHLVYLASFDHEPTEEEKQALTPEEYRDDVPGLYDDLEDEISGERDS